MIQETEVRGYALLHEDGSMGHLLTREEAERRLAVFHRAGHTRIELVTVLGVVEHVEPAMTTQEETVEVMAELREHARDEEDEARLARLITGYCPDCGHSWVSHTLVGGCYGSRTGHRDGCPCLRARQR